VENSNFLGYFADIFVCEVPKAASLERVCVLGDALAGRPYKSLLAQR